MLLLHSKFCVIIIISINNYQNRSVSSISRASRIDGKDRIEPFVPRSERSGLAKHERLIQDR